MVVADDDALLREGIASLLQEAGHEVVGRSGDAFIQNSASRTAPLRPALPLNKVALRIS